MKQIYTAVFLVFAASVTAHAKDAYIGERVKYDVQVVNDDGSTYSETFVREIIDTRTQGMPPYTQYLVRNTAIAVDGTTKTNAQWVDDAGIADRNLGLQLFDSCEDEASHGKLESITVPAGTFKTCALPVQDGRIRDMKFGLVPLGAVQFTEIGQGLKRFFKLNSFNDVEEKNSFKTVYDIRTAVCQDRQTGKVAYKIDRDAGSVELTNPYSGGTCTGTISQVSDTGPAIISDFSCGVDQFWAVLAGEIDNVSYPGIGLVLHFFGKSTIWEGLSCQMTYY